MQVEFPLRLDVVDDALRASQSVAQFLEQRGGGLLVITGKNYSRAYCDELIASADIKPVNVVGIEQSSVPRVYEVERTLRDNQVRHILAVGGGRVADFAKRLAYIANLPLLLVPTIIANDGLISPIAVLLDGSHSVSLPGKMPDEVVIDLSAIKKAPDRYLVAAACDIVTNLSATNDWERAEKGDSARLDHLALHLSRMAAYGVFDCRSWDLRSDAFLRSIVFGQVLSGVAMAIAGSSRPCSGSEHLICHALDHLAIGIEMLHGEKVGIASQFCLYLQNQYTDPVEAFFLTFQIARNFPGCMDASASDLESIFSTARQMRPGRSTILDQYTNRDLVTKYYDFTGAKK